jgi:beta-glucosidase
MYTRIRTSFRLLAIISLVALAGSILLPVVPVQAQPAQDFPPECPWMDTTKSPEQRARLLLDASTLEQKMRWLVEPSANNPSQTTFGGGFGIPVAVYPEQVPCTPVIQYTDGPAAVSGGGSGITAFPAQISLTASWDEALSRLKGQAHGYEAFYKHRNVLLGPGLDSGRTPQNGRNSEYMGEEPLLSGLMAAAMIRGLQEDNPDAPVESVIKHYVANEQETSRQSSSSNIDERTLHEIYTLPFEIAIKEGNPGGVMCAFNQVNGAWSCENESTLKNILKGDIGFDGWVVSDFFSVHSVGPSLVNGMDQELVGPRLWNPTNLNAALAAGEITEAQIDEAAYRVVRSHIAARLFDHPLPPAPLDNVSTPENQAVARQVAEEGSVLLKNEGGILPLSDRGHWGRDDKYNNDKDKNDCKKDKHGNGCSSSPITIAVIGPTTSNTPTGGVSAATVCAYRRPGVPCTPVAPLDAITARAALDGDTVVFDNGSDLVVAAATAGSADVAIVFGYYTEGEGNDRPNLSLENNGDALISAVAGANPNTIVILQTGGPVLMPWIDQVKGVLETWYAGQEMGNAIAALLWGDVNPSGKLPETFSVLEADLPTAGSAAQYPGIVDANGIRQVDYTEGLQVGYRWYDSQGIEPLFPFGFGLSYTTFKYSHLQVTPSRAQSNKEIRVKFQVTNTGRVTGTEVAQVYLKMPSGLGEPPKRLVGWARVTLEPGEHQNVTVTIDPNSSAHPLSFWDTNVDGWVTAPGTYTVLVGSSSRDLPLHDSIQIRVK